MKLHDDTQNLGARIGTIQIIVFVLLTLLGIRLYFLQIVKGEYYSERAENQRIRLIPIPAPRGAIFDRDGVLLVDSRPTYNVTLTREPIRNIDIKTRLDEYAEGLRIDKEFLEERLSPLKDKRQPKFETMVLKENATIQDISWVESHTLEFPELRIELQPQRYYPHGESVAHVLGYVGEISPKQLEKPEMKDFKPGDIIGKGGLEQSYDAYLRGKPGHRKVIVDSRGRVQREIEVIPPQPGQDLISTIDLVLQKAAEEQLANSVTKRGTIIVTDPRNGEVLAMASAPSFDPNAFVMRSATTEGRKEIANYYTNEDRPLLNRAIQGRYHPGSTWKIVESVAGLQQGAITISHSNLTCGGGIKIGSKFTRCMGSHGTPPLSYAITKSCDGYYYRLGLKMGLEGIIKMVEEFEYDKRTGVDLPNEKISQTPKSWRAYVERNEGEWKDIRTVYASIGQDTVVVTPISMLRAVSSVGMKGRMYVPHFLKKLEPIGAVGEEDEPNYVKAKEAVEYEQTPPKVIKMTPAQNELVVKGMWGVVNAGGTAARLRMSNLEIAGKTGTAQNSALGSGGAKDHAWFVSFAPAYKPEIAVIALIENSGFGSTHAVPAVKGVYEAFLQKRDLLEVDESQVAKK